MLLNRNAIAIADNGHSVELYGYDVTKMLSGAYGQVAARFETGVDTLNLNKPFFDDIRDDFRKAMEYCVNEVIKIGDKSKLATMMREQFVEYKPEILNKIRNTMSVEDAMRNFDRITDKLMELEPELAAFHASKELGEEVDEYCKEKSLASPEQNSELELK